MKNSKRKILAAVTVAALGIIAVACSTDVALADDEVVCIYGRGEEDGFGLKEGPILPGDKNSIEVSNENSDRPVVRIPLSNRFYEVSKDDASRDAGADSFIRVFDKDGIPVHVQAKIHFVFNAEAGCDWFDAHGARNSSSRAQYGDVVLERFDMGFNVRGGIVTPWIKVLNEQHGQVLEDVVNLIVDDYSWKQMSFNGDVDRDGVDTPVKTVIEDRLAGTFTDQWHEEYGDVESDRRFFCGTTHNQASPDTCPNMRVQILGISTEDPALEKNVTDLANKADAIETQQEIEDLENEAQLDRLERNAKFVADQQEIATNNAAAEDARLVLEERLSQQRIREAEIAADELAAIEAAALEAANENGVFEQQGRQAQLDAQAKVAPCVEAGITGIDCVYLLAVLNGIDLPDNLGGTYVPGQLTTVGG